MTEVCASTWYCLLILENRQKPLKTVSALISHFEMICLLQIVETMSYTDNVATFLNSLDSFYENVPAEDLELLIGPIIDRVRSRPDSPLSGSPLGNYCLQIFTTHVLLSCQNYFKPVPNYVYLWTVAPCIYELIPVLEDSSHFQPIFDLQPTKYILSC